MASSTTITSLLNSLHSHLQSQTQLLPGLHAQLGLPPTALTDELSALQQQLTLCVETQIDSRRREVDEWMERCAAVEEECLRYSRALGAHVKAQGNTVGEIRKEQVLPRRFERISELQERLRQLYHSKLEQILTITNRLASLANTLDPDFYAPDVLDPPPALGEVEQPDPHRDVTPERFTKLEKELVRGKGELSRRLNQLSSTMLEIDALYLELGMQPPTLDNLPASSLLAPPNLPRPTSACSMMTNTSDPFLMSTSTPTPASRGKPVAQLLFTSDAPDISAIPTDSDSEYQHIFASFIDRLEASDVDLNDPAAMAAIGLAGVDPTPGLLSWAQNVRGELEHIKRRRAAHIQAVFDQLEALWRRFGVPVEAMQQFVTANEGATEEAVRAYEDELGRMIELKRERMGTFVENAREEIIKLWDDLMVGEEERADFAPFVDDEATEELLSIHEEEIRRLKEEKRAKGSLLANIRRYFEICEDEKELAAAATDQTRLLGRGPRDPGRLLREEKMRKRVTKEKPKLEQDLLVSIPAWEAQNDRAFLVHGQSIVQILMEAAGVSSIDKENHTGSNTNANKRTKPLGGRAGSAPPRAKTPHLPAPNSGHSSKNGFVTPAVRPASSMGGRSASHKRPRLGESTAAYNNAVNSGLSSSKGSSTQRPASPTKIPGRTPSSSLPRPVSIAMPVPRFGAQHTLGHGRAPSHIPHSYHPYPPPAQAYAQRSVSNASSLSKSAGAVRKSLRVKRESYRPRPSIDMDDVWAAGSKWAGPTAGSVREEEEF